MSRRGLLCAPLVLAVGLAGCTASTKSKPSAPVVLHAASDMRLVAFESCQQLATDLRAAATESVGPYGFPGSRAIPEVIMNGARTSMGAAAKADAPASAFSGTNVHESDADEPDLVKTDGRRIVTVSAGTLRVVDAATRRLTGKLDLGVAAGGGDLRLLISGDKALVLVSGGFEARRLLGKVVAPSETDAQVLLVDLAGTPRLISRYRGTGTLVDARQTGSTARVVLRSTPRINFPDRPTSTDDGQRTAANRKTVAAAPIDAWLPSWSVTTGASTSTGKVGCDRVSRPSGYSGASMLTIVTFDLGAAALGAGDPVTLVADGDTVYANGTSLYVASDQRWRLDRWMGASNVAVKQETEIYRFETSGTRAPAYAAAGTVPGWLINQYALSEWDGYLRVATTDQSGGASAVRVLQQRDDQLTQLGMVGGLGKGEQIYSVRFIGAQGYVVTFKQTDPLYSLDLSDPAHPKVAGELKITGYSAHLQPAGDGRLIGIGQEANKQGTIQGTQISLFDVSDPAAPRRLAQYRLDGAQSEAEWDPHALLWWPQTKLLVVPATAGARGTNGALALRVADSGVNQLRMVTQPRSGGPQDAWSAGIHRSMVIGDTLWTMSDEGLLASNMSTLDQVGWVPSR